MSIAEAYNWHGYVRLQAERAPRSSSSSFSFKGQPVIVIAACTRRAGKHAIPLSERGVVATVKVEHDTGNGRYP